MVASSIAAGMGGLIAFVPAGVAVAGVVVVNYGMLPSESFLAMLWTAFFRFLVSL